MAKSRAQSDLSRVIKQLQSERQEHLDTVAEIDEQFALFGIGVKPRRGRGRRRGPGRPPKVGKKKAAKNGRRKKRRKIVGKKPRKVGKKKATRKKFRVSGEQSILDFAKKKRGATTAEIVGNWKRQGRGGKADNALTKLVQEGKLKRERIEDGRGSRYSVA